MMMIMTMMMMMTMTMTTISIIIIIITVILVFENYIFRKNSIFRTKILHCTSKLDLKTKFLLFRNKYIVIIALFFYLETVILIKIGYTSQNLT